MLPTVVAILEPATATTSEAASGAAPEVAASVGVASVITSGIGSVFVSRRASEVAPWVTTMVVIFSTTLRAVCVAVILRISRCSETVTFISIRKGLRGPSERRCYRNCIRRSRRRH